MVHSPKKQINKNESLASHPKSNAVSLSAMASNSYSNYSMVNSKSKSKCCELITRLKQVLLSGSILDFISGKPECVLSSSVISSDWSCGRGYLLNAAMS